MSTEPQEYNTESNSDYAVELDSNGKVTKIIDFFLWARITWLFLRDTAFVFGRVNPCNPCLL